MKLMRAVTGMRVAFLAGNTTFTVSQGLVLVSIGRMLGAEGVGIYALALAVVSPVFLLAKLRLQDILATDRTALDQWPTYLKVTGLTNLAALVTTSIIATVWGPELLSIVAPLALSKVAENFILAAQGAAQGGDELMFIVRSNVLRACLSAGILSGALLAWGSLATALWLVAGAWTAQFVLTDARVFRRHAVPSEAQPAPRMSTVLVDLFPLGLASCLLSLNQNGIRILLELEMGTAAIGVFAATAYLVRLGTLFSRAIAQLLSPAIRRANQSGQPDEITRSVRKAADLMVILGASSSVVGALVGPTIMQIALGPSLRPSWQLVAVVLSAGAFLYGSMVLTMGAVGLGLHQMQLWVVSVTLVVALTSAFVLIDWFGVLGAGLAWMVGEGTRFFALRRTIRHRALNLAPRTT